MAFERVHGRSIGMMQVQCVVCGKQIKESRSGRKKFCSDACRAFQWRTGKSATPCHYCGCPGGTIDHVPPQSARPIILKFGLEKQHPFVEVHACSECNSLLGNRALWKLSQRKKFIRRALRRRYKRLLNLPNWTPEQLNELGHTLKSYVQAGLLAKIILKERISW